MNLIPFCLQMCVMLAVALAFGQLMRKMHQPDDAEIDEDRKEKRYSGVIATYVDLFVRLYLIFSLGSAEWASVFIFLKPTSTCTLEEECRRELPDAHL